MNRADYEQVVEIAKAVVQSVMSGYTSTQKSMVAFEQECMRHYTGDSQTISHITFREFLRRLRVFTNQYTEQTIEIIQNLNNLDLTNVFDTYAELNTYYLSAIGQRNQEQADDLHVPTTTLHKDYLYVVLHDESTDGLLNIYKFDGTELVNITQPVKPHKHGCLYYPNSEQKCVESDEQGNIFFYDENGVLTADYNYSAAGKWTFNILEEDNTRDGNRYIEPAARDADIDALFEGNELDGIVLSDEEKPAEEIPQQEHTEIAYDLEIVDDEEDESSSSDGIDAYNIYSTDCSGFPDKVYRDDVLLNVSDGEHYTYIGSGWQISRNGRHKYLEHFFSHGTVGVPRTYNLGELQKQSDGTYRMKELIYLNWSAVHGQLGYALVRNSYDGFIYIPTLNSIQEGVEIPVLSRLN